MKFLANQQLSRTSQSDENKETVKEKLLAEFHTDPDFEKRDAEEKEDYLKRIEEMAMNLSEKLLDVSSAVSDQRNTLNHFGFQKNPAGYDKLQKNLVKRYEELKEVMERDGVRSCG